MVRWRHDRAARRAPAAAEAAQRVASDATEHAALMERLLDAIDEGVILATSGGDVAHANAAARAILGIGPRTSSPGVESIGLRDLVTRAIQSGDTVEEDRSLHLPNRRLLRVRALPFGEGALVLIDDVTAARRSEKVRRDFVANVSHELKTPVSGIGLIAEQLTHAIREDPAEAARFAERIHREADRLTRLVVDLLDLSRIESDLPLEVTDVDPVALAADAAARVEAMAQDKHIAVEVKAPERVLRFRADAAQVTVALANLLDNAVRYSPSGSRVTIQIDGDVREVSFDVADHGPGIPTEELGRIFERFYRVDKARARTTGGTGLGLAIVKHVAERHGGRITAASELGRGSTFTLTFPGEPAL